MYKIYLKQLLLWVESDGSIIDYPKFPLIFKETPFCYVSKMLFVISNILSIEYNEKLLNILRNGLKFFSNIILFNGETQYYGRSMNSIYGYSNLFSALNISISNNFINLDNDMKILYNKTKNIILNNFFINEKYIFLYQDNENIDDIDSYINHADYISYSSYILLKHAVNGYFPDTKQLKDKEIIKTNNWLKYANNEINIIFTLSGQIKFLERNIDPRYSGLIPLKVLKKNKNIFSPIPNNFDKWQ